MEQAIKKAIEGGWRNDFKPSLFMSMDDFIRHIIKDKRFLLDPLFWQALGKAEAWNWRHQCLRFFKYVVADGGDIEVFFKELLK